MFNFSYAGYIVRTRTNGGFKMTNSGFSDKLKGRINKGKGETKDQIGNIIDNASLQAEGKFDKLKSEAQKEIGKLKE
jgi:uncharacterized protein YjbJ (UPF0337 family)